MSVEVINILGRNPRDRTGLLHHRKGGISVRMWLSEVVLVNGRGVANEFSQDVGTSPARALKRFQGEHRRAFTQRQTVSPGIERTAKSGRERPQRGEAREHKFIERVITASQDALRLAATN